FGQEFRQPMEAPSNRSRTNRLSRPSAFLARCLAAAVEPNAGIVTFRMQKTNPPYAVRAYHFSCKNLGVATARHRCNQKQRAIAGALESWFDAEPARLVCDYRTAAANARATGTVLSCASTTAMVAILTMASTSTPRCSRCTGFAMPVRIGPT